MPAVSIDGKPWQIDSTKILENFDFDPISDKELRLVQNAWQSVLQRPRNPFRFFAGFARIQNPEPILFKRYASHFGFSFICFYMFVLINFIKIIVRPKPPVDFGDQFLYWEQAVADSDGPFLDGASPGTRDMLLFGIVQCHASIPVAALHALRDDARLDGCAGGLVICKRGLKTIRIFIPAHISSPHCPSLKRQISPSASFFTSAC